MNNLLKRIKYLILTFKEKDLKNKLKRTIKKSYSNNSSKLVFSKGADLTLNSETLKAIETVKQEVTTIVKKTDANPDLLLNYVKMGKTQIYFHPFADKLLNLIKEEEGLIYEKHGLEAIYLGLVTGQGFKLKTEPMFFMRNGVIDKFYLLHNFYRWYSLKSNLPGFEYNVQKLFKKFLFDNSQKFIKSLSMEEIISLKEAIARDNEASEFVLNYTKQIDGSKKVINKIKNEGGANI
jgi:hypothetical protein